MGASLRIEKLAGPENPELAAAQAAAGWVSVCWGPFVVVGTSDVCEGMEFVRELFAANRGNSDLE